MMLFTIVWMILTNVAGLGNVFYYKSDGVIVVTYPTKAPILQDIKMFAFTFKYTNQTLVSIFQWPRVFGLYYIFQKTVKTLCYIKLAKIDTFNELVGKTFRWVNELYMPSEYLYGETACR